MNIKKWVIFFCLIFSSSLTWAQEQQIFAIDLIRHGDRAPIIDIPNAKSAWKEGLGELTQQGFKQAVKLGESLRQEYIYQSHLLPEFYTKNSLYVRTTNISRTLKTADALLLGLYPLDTRPLNEKIPIQFVPPKEDRLLLAKPKRDVWSLMKRYKATRAFWKEKTIHLKEKLKYWQQQTGLPLHNANQLIQLADNLYIRRLNQLPLPSELSEQDANLIIELSDSIILNEFKLTEVTQPMGEEFLKTVKNYLENAIQQKSNLKYVLFVGHDSTLLSVLNTLHSPPDKMPSYLARLNFSLIKSNEQYFVKITYNNNPIYIPACKNKLCTLSEFEQWGQVAPLPM